MEKYSIGNICMLEEMKEKCERVCLDKYGIKSYSQPKSIDIDLKKYLYENEVFDSSWELYYWIYCEENNIPIKRNHEGLEYIYGNKVHIYYPSFIVDDTFVEIKDDQFFKKDGTMQNPYDHTLDELYEAKHLCGLSNNVRYLKEDDIKIAVEYVNKKFTEEYVPLFNVSLPFPYLNADLMDKSDMGLIHHFHKSIYEATRKGKSSPLSAWSNKDIIKKVALNRLKYKGKCDSATILQGFNVTRTANKVSVFKPTLAKELLEKYSHTNDIFDPFSGFSGRMLGSISLGKKYLGQDINEDHVRESNEIIAYKDICDQASVVEQDIVKDGFHDYSSATLFTCPPYGGKEHWNKNCDEIEKTCDEWIDICLEKYKCKEYIFVVDETTKYKNFIVDTIENKSHFGKNNEYIIYFTLEDL